MNELEEVARLRSDIGVPATDRAFAVLAAAIDKGGAVTRSRSPGPRRIWPPNRYLAITVVAAAVALVATVLSLPRLLPSSAGSSDRRLVGFQPGPSQGVAHNAYELVDYATRAAAHSPVFMPGPSDWIFVQELDKGPSAPANGYASRTWRQVGTVRMATEEHGKLRYGYGGGPGAQLQGWPGDNSTLYRYLTTLPSSPTELRKVILANNNANPAAAFDAISFLMNDFPLPSRLQAELYAVLLSLPGVHFASAATDAAGRPGVGLYMIQDGYLKTEIIVSPRSYTYLGLLWVAVKAHTEYGTSPAVLHLHKGSIEAWNAIIRSGIVRQAGQLPGGYPGS